MILRSVRHQDQRRQDVTHAEHVDGFIADAPPGWHVHRLIGDRQGEWSVSVSRNWRITFEEEAGYIDRLNLEDYH